MVPESTPAPWYLPTMDCRSFCGACCIAPSITSLAKPAGEPCRYLDADLRCTIFGRPERPAVCSKFQADELVCGRDAGQALELLSWLEQSTAS